MTRRPKQRSGQHLTYLVPLVLILIVAAGLRFYALDAQSFWNDEGNTARLVERSVFLILEGAAGDIHPPGYYLLLHLWRAVAGQSEFALRAYSALCGVLTVAVTAAASRRLAPTRQRGGLAAWTAALLVAINPLAVYYSQEARMYAQLGLMSALTLWVGLMVGDSARKPRRLTLLAFAGCIAAGLYTQYTYILALVGLNLAFGATWVLRLPWKSSRLGRRSDGLLLRWIAGHALGGLLFLPWAPIAIGAGGWRPPDLDATAALRTMAHTLVVGVTHPEAPGTVAVVAGGLLVCAAILVSLRSRRASLTQLGIWAATSMALSPPLLIAIAGIYRPAYLKFLILCIAPAAVALTAPLLSLGRGHATRAATGIPWRQIGGLLMVATLLPDQSEALRHLYTNPTFFRDDYRAIASHIAQQGRSGDAIVLNAPNQWEVFTYYYRGPLPVYPSPYRPNEPEAESWVAARLTNHPDSRLFVLFWGDSESDPGQLIERALAQQAYKAGDEWITTVRLASYGVHPLPAKPDTGVGATLGGAVTLEAIAPPGGVWEAGNIVPLTLFWRTEAALTERYKVFVHLVDATGMLVGQTDSEPVAGFRPTTTWQSGEVITDRYGLELPTNLPPGTYTLRAGMYRFSGERLPVAARGADAGDFITLSQISVAAPR